MTKMVSPLDLAHVLTVSDVSADAATVRSTPDHGEADGLAFRRLGTVRMQRGAQTGVPMDANVAVHVSKYGDAYLFLDPRQPDVPTRFLSILHSGAIVETLLVPSRSGTFSGAAFRRSNPSTSSGAREFKPKPDLHAPEPARMIPPPPANTLLDLAMHDAHAPGPSLDRESERSTSQDLLRELGITVAGEQWEASGSRPAPKKRRPAAKVTSGDSTTAPFDEPPTSPTSPTAPSTVDRLLAELEGSTRLARFPTIPECGVYRQALDMDDANSLWVAHRGFLRRMQGQDDDVVDHQRVDVFRAALRRLEHVAISQVGLEQGPNTSRSLDILQGALLGAPLVLALLQGMALWVAVVVGAFTIGGAFFVVNTLHEPEQRMRLWVVPVAVLVVGWLTVGWFGLGAVLTYGVGVLLAREPYLRPFVARWSARTAGEGVLTPAPVPMPALLERYL